MIDKILYMGLVLLLLTTSCVTYTPSSEDIFDQMVSLYDQERIIILKDFESEEIILLDGLMFTKIYIGRIPTQDTKFIKTFSLLDVDESSIEVVREDRLYLDNGKGIVLQEDAPYVKLKIKTGKAKLEEVFTDDREPRVISFDTELVTFGFYNEETAKRFMNEFINLVQSVKDE